MCKTCKPINVTACAKCPGKHETRDCDKDPGKIQKVEWCNCGDKHAASYRCCPKFPKAKPTTFFTSNHVPPTQSVTDTLKLKNFPPSRLQLKALIP